MEGIKQRSIIEYELNELNIIQKESHILSEQIEVNSLRVLILYLIIRKPVGKLLEIYLIINL